MSKTGSHPPQPSQMAHIDLPLMIFGAMAGTADNSGFLHFYKLAEI